MLDFCRLLVAALGVSSVLGGALAHAQSGEAVCGSLKHAYGPYDYRTASPSVLANVEDFHFKPYVENLTGSQTGLTPANDISYTLKVFPNHHRALMSMMKYVLREKNEKPPEAVWSMHCWFDRAERFQPDDAMVKVIHGLYLIQTGKPADAITKLEQARELDSNNANVHYNLGLAYFDLKKFDQALESAHVAYAQGFPLPGLRDKLRRAGKWSDPVPVVESASPEVTMPESVEDAVQPDPQAAPAAD